MLLCGRGALSRNMAGAGERKMLPGGLSAEKDRALSDKRAFIVQGQAADCRVRFPQRQRQRIDERGEDVEDVVV